KALLDRDTVQCLVAGKEDLRNPSPLLLKAHRFYILPLRAYRVESLRLLGRFLRAIFGNCRKRPVSGCKQDTYMAIGGGVGAGGELVIDARQAVFVGSGPK
ncbi:MAG: hypothetical protein Q9174_003838, partial [Haloplaca sp. 1 TL-2023]